MQAALGNVEVLKIYGKDWPTYDGTGVRDYIHVMDVANGQLLALEHLIDNPSKILTFIRFSLPLASKRLEKQWFYK